MWSFIWRRSARQKKNRPDLGYIETSAAREIGFAIREKSERYYRGGAQHRTVGAPPNNVVIPLIENVRARRLGSISASAPTRIPREPPRRC